ncbi:hypothetical protein F5880DRAFT_1479728, partial [Lentinula raphanica]
QSAISENPVTVFSKTTCPFCTATKSLFSNKFPNVPVKVLELDLREDGPAIQAYLAQKTGQQTVPNVFVSECLQLIVLQNYVEQALFRVTAYRRFEVHVHRHIFHSTVSLGNDSSQAAYQSGRLLNMLKE